MKLTKEQIREILYKSCEENDTDIGSINFDEISDGLNKHLNEYLGQSLSIHSVIGCFKTFEECEEEGVEHYLQKSNNL